jgi:hypothetical protein
MQNDTDHWCFAPGSSLAKVHFSTEIFKIVPGFLCDDLISSRISSYTNTGGQQPFVD